MRIMIMTSRKLSVKLIETMCFTMIYVRNNRFCLTFLWKMTQITGFGAFGVAKCVVRKGRNPATGKEIKIVDSKAHKFKAGALLKKAVK